MSLKVLSVIPWYEVPAEKLVPEPADIRPVNRNDLSDLSDRGRKYVGQGLYITDLLVQYGVEAAVFGEALKGDEEALATIFSLILLREKSEEKATEMFNSLVYFRTNGAPSS